MKHNQIPITPIYAEIAVSDDGTNNEDYIKECLAHKLSCEIVKNDLFEITREKFDVLSGRQLYQACVYVAPPPKKEHNTYSAERNKKMVTFDICEGNPGAFTFLMRAYETDMFRAERAFRRMQDNDITGSKLYMLWNDCCNRNTKMALVIMENYAIEDIVEHINYKNGRGIPYPIEEGGNK